TETVRPATRGWRLALDRGGLEALAGVHEDLVEAGALGQGRQEHRVRGRDVTAGDDEIGDHGPGLRPLARLELIAHDDQEDAAATLRAEAVEALVEALASAGGGGACGHDEVVHALLEQARALLGVLDGVHLVA